MKINHIAITLKSGQEDQARDFYGKILDLTEVPKPEVLRKNGGVWFQLPGDLLLHFTVQDDFDPHISKAHIGYEVSDLNKLKLTLSHYNIDWTVGEKIPGFERINIRDPFGNKIELMGHVSN